MVGRSRWALVIPAIYGLVAETYLVFRGVTFNEDGWNYAQVMLATGDEQVTGGDEGAKGIT